MCQYPLDKFQPVLFHSLHLPRHHNSPFRLLLMPLFYLKTVNHVLIHLVNYLTGLYTLLVRKTEVFRGSRSAAAIVRSGRLISAPTECGAAFRCVAAADALGKPKAAATTAHQRQRRITRRQFKVCAPERFVGTSGGASKRLFFGSTRTRFLLARTKEMGS